jgi:hypothetical protein
MPLHGYIKSFGLRKTSSHGLTLHDDIVLCMLLVKSSCIVKNQQDVSEMAAISMESMEQQTFASTASKLCSMTVVSELV